MKTTQLLMTGLLILSSTAILKAQATQATNAISSTSYLGTSNNNNVVFKRQGVAAGLISTTNSSFGLNSNSSSTGTFFGISSGQFATGQENIYIGRDAGKGQSASILNTGHSNLIIGNGAGVSNTSGSGNVFIGNSTAHENRDGSYNVYVGFGVGGDHESGSFNTFLGTSSGYDNRGSNNVFIGYSAGISEMNSNKLYIESSGSANPLIWGDFESDQIKFNGKVGIGGNSSTGFGNYPTSAGSVNLSSYNLFVKGGILTEELRVALQGTWADYVFKKEYKLPTLDEVEKYIEENGHLKNVPSAKEVKENGIELGEMARIQQEKIEELTLYIIEQNRINENQKKQLEKQEKEIEELKIALQSLFDKKQ